MKFVRSVTLGIDMKLIKPDMPIDYYIVYYPKMVMAFYEVKKNGPQCILYDDNLIKHIQLVIQEHNEGYLL